MPAAQNIQLSASYIVLLVFLLLLVVYLLSSEMTTRVIDFLKNSIEHKECEQSTWRLEPVVFERSERKCVTLHLRESDHNIEDTKYAIENVLALMCSERMSTKFSLRRNWEVDFVRFLLRYSTFDEEQSFNTLTKDQCIFSRYSSFVAS